MRAICPLPFLPIKRLPLVSGLFMKFRMQCIWRHCLSSNRVLSFPLPLRGRKGRKHPYMENLGELWVGYNGQPKSTQFGRKSQRLAIPLEPGFVHTVEPGIYFIPELIDLWKGEKKFKDFKKRGAHTHQFIISDTGCGIAEEQRENIFKPFTEVKDLTQGDGLGLPICALIAAKMDGSLTLDSSYAKGTRFVLELHA